MDHCIANFDASWEPIREDTSSFALQNREQGTSICRVGIVHVDGAGQLTLQMTRNLMHFVEISDAHDEAKRSENFFAEDFVL